MKKKIFSVLLIVALITTLLGCGAKSYIENSDYNSMVVDYSDEMMTNGMNFSYDAGAYNDEYAFEAEDVVLTNKIQTTANLGRKIIYSANYNIKTTEFEKAVSELDKICNKYNAYYERSEIYGLKENADRTGYFTIRVPAENYNAFKNEAGGIGVVTHSSENNRDVTETYIDTEARLTSAKLREERLLAILENANSLDNVLLLEAELANVRYEIESLSGSLRKYDSLISYSTITVDISESVEPVEVKIVPKTFSERFSTSLSEGFKDFGKGVENFCINTVYNLPEIIIFAVVVIILIIVIKIIVKKIKKKLNDTTEIKKDDKTKMSASENDTDKE